MTEIPATGEMHPRTTVHFVFCNHEASNLDRVFAAIRDTRPDVVAIEFVDHIHDEKVEGADAITRAIRYGEPLPYEYSGGYPEYVVSQLADTNAQVVFTDIDKDSPENTVLEKYVDARDKALKSIYFDDPMEDQLTSLLSYIDAEARSNEVRESVTESQLIDLIAQNPGKTITVMAGANHTALMRVVRPHAHVQKTFVDTAENEADHRGRQKIQYPECVRAARVKRFGGTVSAQLLRQARDSISDGLKEIEHSVL